MNCPECERTLDIYTNMDVYFCTPCELIISGYQFRVGTFPYDVTEEQWKKRWKHHLKYIDIQHRYVAWLAREKSTVVYPDEP